MTLRTVAGAWPAVGLALAGAALSGCYFDEGLDIENLVGTVVVPEEAATRTITVDGEEQTITDVRLIGPVILGLFPGVSEGIFQYPHPAVGPSFQQGIAGDTYPYGGTTVGDIRFACVQALTCKLSSGRHVDFQSIIDWNAMIGQPVTDAFGNEITSGLYLRDICFDYLEASSEDELRITVTSDRNGDGALDQGDLDFIQRNDGKFEAAFTIWQQEFFQDPETGTGFTLWGWHDTPSADVFSFKTCDPNDGFNQVEYNTQFDAGRFPRDLLNSPSEYIEEGDWVASQGFQYETSSDIAEIEIDFLVEDL